MYVWENEKLLMLTRNDSNKTAPSNQNSHHYLKDLASSTQSLINLTTTNSVKVFGKLYNNNHLKTERNNESGNRNFDKEKYKTMFKNAFISVKKTFLYIVSLAKPATIESGEFIDNIDITTQDEVLTKNKNQSFDNPVDRNDIHANITENTTHKTIDYNKIKEEATIGLIRSDVSDLQKSKDGATVFVKYENRLLAKLKDSGMANYDIWLELGDMYLKYNESKKAIEIYALVLKHSKNEKQKETARNGLIGI